MAGSPENRPMIRDERRERAAETGEPLYDPEMSFYPVGNTVALGIPIAAREILNIRAGDSQRVEVYEHGLWVPRGEHDE
jgi:hypothetical protein